MVDNILDIILREKEGEYKKYSDDLIKETYVNKILIHFLRWQELENSNEYKSLCNNDKNKLRLEYDCDAYYYNKIENYSFNEALKGDTMISFWVPYKLALYQNTGWNYSKTEKSLKNLIKNINNKNKQYLDVNEKFEDFAKIYYTKGNFLLLPDKQMNNSRYEKCEDRIDETIYECFKGGKLAGYFKGDSDLINWINNQNLNSIFKNGDIQKENIILLNKPKLFTPFYMSLSQIDEYICNAVKLISERNR